jgi:hypothetical protein
MVGGFERDQPTGLGGQPLLQGSQAGLTDAFIHNQDGPRFVLVPVQKHNKIMDIDIQ